MLNDAVFFIKEEISKKFLNEDKICLTGDK